MHWPSKLKWCIRRPLAHQSIRNLVVLGIETSCDDTGCAVVDDNGRILGDSLNSQESIHLRHGGIIPPIARDLHAESIEAVAKEAICRSGLRFPQLDAVAATVKPGLALSLTVGATFAQRLAQTHDLPFIPIHHMEAHALTARMVEQVDFPYLVLLMSGGHCQLAVADDVDRFLLLGSSLDDAPGEAFDKISRRLKLTNLPELRTCNGGSAVEKMASGGDPSAFAFSPVLTHTRDCHFTFSGVKNAAKRHIMREEETHGVAADGVIPSAADLCASFLATVAKHICQRVQRGMEYVEMKNLIPQQNRCLVAAGGVACNKEIARQLRIVCEETGYRLVVPPPSLCTDNGIMIAWNGVERLRRGFGIVPAKEAHTISVQPKCGFGEDHSHHVIAEDIKCKWIKLDPKHAPKSDNISAS